MMRRTTVAADADDLAVLESDARRRGVSLAQVLREMVADKAEEVRRTRRPRYPLFASGDGSLSERSWMDEDAPYRDDAA
jgi:Ribbon-helix-helix protein, copG family